MRVIYHTEQIKENIAMSKIVHCHMLIWILWTFIIALFLSPNFTIRKKNLKLMLVSGQDKKGQDSKQHEYEKLGGHNKEIWVKTDTMA